MSPNQSETYLLLDPSARDLDLDAHAWIQPIIIEDEDLMFGGKTLSAWYEEERSRLRSSSSSGSGSSDDGRRQQSLGNEEEEERRGRERVRSGDGRVASKGHRK